MNVSKTISMCSRPGLCLHSLQRIINRLRLFTNTLAFVRSLSLKLCNAGALTFFQSLGIHRQEDRRRLRSKRCDLEVLNPRDGNDVIVAVVAGSGRASVDGDEIEDWAGGEEGAFEGLRLGSGSGEFDAGRMRVSLASNEFFDKSRSKS